MEGSRSPENRAIEWNHLPFFKVTKCDLEERRNIKHLPYAFTEQGIAMLSSVLRSDRAVQVNIEIMRAFVRLRQMLASHAELAEKLAELEKKYDVQFKVVFDALRELMKPPDSGHNRQIGFISPAKNKRSDGVGNGMLR
jgi:hypothetical protein